MPHITVKMYKGRTPEMKAEMVEKIRQAVFETIKCPINVISLAVEEYDPAEWPEVFEKETDRNKAKGELYFVKED